MYDVNVTGRGNPMQYLPIDSVLEAVLEAVAAAAAPVSLETTCIVVFSEGQKM